MTNLQQMSNALRQLSADMVDKAQSGHPGMPLGMADIMTVLMHNHLRFNPADPQWPNRDRFILSNGHGSALLYSTLHLLGYAEMSHEQLTMFRQLGSKTPGHPERDISAGIETTTGPLGQGFANAVGVALAGKLLGQRLGSDVINYNTYVFAGDGCLMEGINHEAASLAGHLKLDNLIVIFDDNRVTIDGITELSTSEDECKRFEAYGWHTIHCDGHDFASIDSAIEEAKQSPRPTLIAARTIIGQGAPTQAGSHKIHGTPLSHDELETMRSNLGVGSAPFAINKDICDLWLNAGKRHHDEYTTWQSSHLATYTSYRDEVAKTSDPVHLNDALESLTQDESEGKPLATRKASERVLTALTQNLTGFIGGSADLTASNNTKAPGMSDILAHHHSGNYINYGIREHAMAAIMNGLALNDEFVPYGGTFLVFSDYLRPALRLSALMKRKVIYVLTHDSIGLGEDGPTHQPVEHLAALRAIPNLHVIRPADMHETTQGWISALTYQGPTVLVLSRQNLPQLDRSRATKIKDMTVFPGTTSSPTLTLIATGSEVEIACETQALLATKNVDATVISVPNKATLASLPTTEKTRLIPDADACVVIEAATATDWYGIVGTGALVCGVETFGESAPHTDIYAQRGLTAPAITDKILKHFT